MLDELMTQDGACGGAEEDRNRQNAEKTQQGKPLRHGKPAVHERLKLTQHLWLASRCRLSTTKIKTPHEALFPRAKGQKGTRLFVFLLSCGEKSIPKKLLIETFFHIARENVEFSLQEASGFPYSPARQSPTPAALSRG